MGHFSVEIYAPPGSNLSGNQQVDTYEVGAKTNWGGAVPGNFNIAGYYNNFTNQQLLLGVSDNLPNAPGINTMAGTASVVNAGKSRLYGFEADLSIRPFQGFRLSASYAYLNTKLQKFVAPTLPAGSPYDTVTSPAVGGPIPNSQPHKVNVSAQYTLPLPESVGEVSVGATYIYTASYRAVNDQCPKLPTTGCLVAAPGAGILPSTNVVNLNVNWNRVAGLPVDASFFVTNLTKEVVYLTANDSLGNRGFLSSLLGEPRMYGFRLRYRFGN